MIVLDTSFIHALLDAGDRRHREALGWYERIDEELVTTPLVPAEADHLAGARGGPLAQRALRADIRAGAYRVGWWPTAATDTAAVAEHHADIDLGLTDASLVALAGRIGCVDIATFDERHFRAVVPLAGAAAFRLLPLDEGR